eukprot:5837741-Pleurochrysis_carterae.AAC.1
MMDRIALSATPFSWRTCGGQVDVCTPSDARRSVNSRDRNSPASSLCRVPTMRVHRLVTGVIVHDHECILAGTVDGFDERPGTVYVNQPPGIGGSVAVAEQDGGRDCDRLAGASDTSDGRALMRAAPAWRRRCIQRAASLADMTCM